MFIMAKYNYAHRLKINALKNNLSYEHIIFKTYKRLQLLYNNNIKKQFEMNSHILDDKMNSREC